MKYAILMERKELPTQRRFSVPCKDSDSAHRWNSCIAYKAVVAFDTAKEAIESIDKMMKYDQKRASIVSFGFAAKKLKEQYLMLDHMYDAQAKAIKDL